MVLVNYPAPEMLSKKLAFVFKVLYSKNTNPKARVDVPLRNTNMGQHTHIAAPSFGIT